MLINQVKSVYLLGIGGIGMSALAKYFVGKGASVAGYDLTPTEITDELIQMGINIHFVEDVKLIPKDLDLVIYTPAIPKTHSELCYAIENNILMLKRSEVLGVITKDKKTIAICGTHGKTTTTAACSHFFHQSGVDINAFIGGVALNFNSNYCFNTNASTYIVEADEFDRSFLTLHPEITIVTSMEADHLDIYGSSLELEKSFIQFFQQINSNGYLIYHKGLLLPKIENVNTLSYHLSDENADVFASNINVENGKYIFNLNFKGKQFFDLHFGIPGIHNLENAIAAVAALLIVKEVNEESLKRAFESFKGVHRRFETVFEDKNMLLIDDYAHHPTEISTCLNSIKALYPDKKISAVFQPHLYSRTRDFADGFAHSLSLADNLILLDIYPARELPIEGITSEFLLKKVNLKNKTLVKSEDLIFEIDKLQQDIIVMMGAGNIDRKVDDVKKYLENKYHL